MQGSASPRRLSQGEQRVLDSFYVGRLPAGQLHAELCRARERELADAATRESPVAARLSVTARELRHPGRSYPAGPGSLLRKRTAS
jgi:hypothetical protein